MGVAPRRLLLAALVLLLSGCQVKGEGPLIEALNTVLETELHTLLGYSVVWALVGAAVGLLLGIVACVAINKLGGYQWGWAHAKWFRWLASALVILSGACAGGAVGLGKGMTDGFEVVLRKSQLATEVFPVAGEVAADLIAALYFEAPATGLAPEEAAKKRAERVAKLAAFRAGSLELDVVDLAAQGQRLQSAPVADVIKELEDEALGKFPSWRGGTFERVLDTVLVTVGEALVSYEAKKMGLGRVVKHMRAAIDALPEAAAKRGDPKTLDRDELAAHVVQFGVVPTLMVPVRSFFKGYQAAALGLYAGVLLLPVAAFRFAEWLRTREPAPASAAPPPPAEQG